MIQIAMYAVQWEWQAARNAERLVDAEQSRVARMLLSATEPSQPKQRSRRHTSVVKRLVSALGYT